MNMQMLEALAKLAKSDYTPVKTTKEAEFVELTHYAAQGHNTSRQVTSTALLRNDGSVFVPRAELHELEEHMRTLLACLGVYVPITVNGLSELPVADMVSEATHRIGVLMQFYEAAGHKFDVED